MAFGKALVLLLAAFASAAAQTLFNVPVTNYDPFYHPTGRPASNTLAGAASQRSPGFPQISKLLPLVQADTIGPSLNTGTTRVILAATWDFGNPVAAPAGVFRRSATSAPNTPVPAGTAPPTNQQGRRLLQANVTGPGSCVTVASTAAGSQPFGNNQACALAQSIAGSNCTCPTSAVGRKLLSTTGRSLLQTLPAIGRQQFFGECKEDFNTLFANCNYVFDAASFGLRANIQTGVTGNTFLSCTLFYDDGSFVTSTSCFSSGGTTPTVVRLNAKSIEYAKDPSTAGALAPGTRISPMTFLAANYRAPNGFLFSCIFRPVQTFGVYINEEHQIYPGQ